MESHKIHDSQSKSSLEDVLQSTINYLRAEAPDTAQLKTLERFQQFGLTEEFSFYSLDDKETLFTGYFQPLLKGSLKKSREFSYPIYANTQTNATRRDIDSSGALAGKELEIAWVDDPYTLFFAHIQGLGVIEFPDGSKKYLRHVGHNNQRYFPIGAYLVEKGIYKKEEVTAQKIVEYLKQNPQQSQDILNLNPRYIFFRLEDQGPLSVLGMPLIPMRSLACDWNFYPPGTLCYLDLELPTFDNMGRCNGSISSSFYAVCQDSGSAIIGSNRIDLFCGVGEDAWCTAGHLKHRGKTYIISLKN